MRGECGGAFARDLRSLACLEAALRGVLRMLEHARWAAGVVGAAAALCRNAGPGVAVPGSADSAEHAWLAPEQHAAAWAAASSQWLGWRAAAQASSGWQWSHRCQCHPDGACCVLQPAGALVAPGSAPS
jgi:hypothetical protein